MSEIRKMAKEWIKSELDHGWLCDCLGDEDGQHYANVCAIITDLLAELERVEKDRDRMANDALAALAGVVCTPIEGFVKIPYELKTGILELRKMNELADQRIAGLEANLKHVQGIAKSAMDKLPERWNLGFQAGLKQAIPYEKELTEALAAERQGRKDDNAALTEDILRLEAENGGLQKRLFNALIDTRLDKANQRIAELEAENERMKADLSGSFFVEQIRQKAAAECVEIAENHHQHGESGAWIRGRQNVANAIKRHFHLEDK